MMTSTGRQVLDRPVKRLVEAPVVRLAVAADTLEDLVGQRVFGIACGHPDGSAPALTAQRRESRPQPHVDALDCTNRHADKQLAPTGAHGRRHQSATLSDSQRLPTTEILDPILDAGEPGGRSAGRPATPPRERAATSRKVGQSGPAGDSGSTRRASAPGRAAPSGEATTRGRAQGQERSRLQAIGDLRGRARTQAPERRPARPGVRGRYGADARAGGLRRR